MSVQNSPVYLLHTYQNLKIDAFKKYYRYNGNPLKWPVDKSSDFQK